MRQQMLMKENAELKAWMDQAKFKFEFGLLMIGVGRTDEAAQAFDDGFKLLTKHKENADG